MIYNSGKMLLKEVRVVLKNPVNDILICQDVYTAGGSLYTVLAVKDHSIVKEYLELFEEAENETKKPYIDSFSENGCFYMVFPYRKERYIRDFYMGDSYSLADCEDICINLVLTCLTADLPYPILYLILTQGQVHMAKDHSVYLSYEVDLTKLDKSITESDCVIQCAKILTGLLEPKASMKAASYLLLQKKVDKKSYHHFTELYKDIRIAAVSRKKKGLLARIRFFFSYHRDELFRVLLFVCTILAVLAVLSLISQLVFGEVIWLRIFINGFKRIGTESLLQ